jgi:hypothetical protein
MPTSGRHRGAAQRVLESRVSGGHPRIRPKDEDSDVQGFVARVSEIRLCDSAVSTRVCSRPPQSVIRPECIHEPRRQLRHARARVLARWVDRRPGRFVGHARSFTNAGHPSPSHAISRSRRRAIVISHRHASAQKRGDVAGGNDSTHLADSRACLGTRVTAARSNQGREDDGAKNTVVGQRAGASENPRRSRDSPCQTVWPADQAGQLTAIHPLSMRAMHRRAGC